MLKRLLPFFVIYLLCVLPSVVNGQDARFAQFYAAPLHVNPAMIGVFEGQYRIALNYRELYSSILQDKPFRTIGASFDIRNRVQRRDYAAFGVSLLKDDAGIANFSRIRGNIGGSFMKQLTGGRYARGDQYLVIGGQMGFGQRGYDWNNLWFSQQFNTQEAFIDFGGNNGESFDNRKTNVYVDFNAGLLWYAIFDENKSIYFGGAMHHINRPNISFLEDREDVLDPRWVGHAGGELPFTDQLSILPALAVFSQGQSFSTTMGANFRYTNKDWKEVALRAGGWAHVSNRLDSGVLFDALTFTAVLEMERWNLGISYDATTSSLTSANNARGAFELSLIYTHPEKSRRKSISCPHF